MNHSRNHHIDNPDTPLASSAFGRGSCPGHLIVAVEDVSSVFAIKCAGNDRAASIKDHVVAEAEARKIPHALLAIDVAQLERKADEWNVQFPRVKPFYAVKSLPDPVVLTTLAASGVNFDCASSLEIDMALAAGATPDRIIFANPAKFPVDIEHARRVDVRKMTFDNDDELEKVKQIFPDAELVLRIVTDDSASVCRLSNKYGASLEDCPFLLERAQQLQLNVIGVSFHVGSGASEPSAFVESVANARKVFDMAADAGLPPFHLLDIGGGFPGDDEGCITTQQIADVVNPALEKHFPSHDIEVISEPGRFFSHSSATLAVRIISRRKVRTKSEGDPDILYYLGDGVYGSFNCMLYDHYTPQVPTPHTFEERDMDSSRVLQSRVFGPTCDGLDTIYESVALPQLEIGDLLIFKNMGAYTIAAASGFNGVTRPEVMHFRTS